MNPTERFSNRAEDYRRHRPSYPPAVIDLIRDIAGLKAGDAVADIGSGTGILTKLLLEAGFDVTAVEPNEPMRLVAEEALRHFPLFHSVAAAAEKTTLPSGSFKAITVAQAFHWFEPEAARREFKRLLYPDGWVFLIRNQRHTEGTSFACDYENLLKSLGEAYAVVANKDNEIGERSRREFFSAGSLSVARFDNPHILDHPGFRGRFLSASYVPAKGDPRHDDYLDRVDQLFRTHAVNDHVIFNQTAEVYYGKLAEKS